MFTVDDGVNVNRTFEPLPIAALKVAAGIEVRRENTPQSEPVKPMTVPMFVVPIRRASSSSAALVSPTAVVLMSTIVPSTARGTEVAVNVAVCGVSGNGKIGETT